MLAAFSIFAERPGAAVTAPGLRLPVVFLIPRQAGPLQGFETDVARETAEFDRIYAPCGIVLEVKTLASFELPVPLDEATAAALLAVGPVTEPGTPALVPGDSRRDPEFFPKLQMSLAAAAARYASSGLSVVYLDPLINAPSDRYAYSDAEGGLVVIGGSEGKGQIWRKVLAHELGHVVFEEFNLMGVDNLMSDGAEQLVSPSVAITPAQCAKARAFIAARRP